MFQFIVALLILLLSNRECCICVAFNTPQLSSSIRGNGERDVGIRSTSSMYASPKHANNDVNKEQNGKANKIPTQRGNRVFNSVLDDNGFGERLLKISRQDLPLIAEVHASGKWQLCIITGFKVPSTIIKASKTGESCDKFVICPPLANILMIEKGANYQDNTDVEKLSCVVDIGQITSIWKVVLKSNQKSVNDMAMKLSKYLGDTDSNMQTLPVNRIENSMQLLYENCKGNNKSKGLTKKDIVKITSSIPLSEHAQHLDQLLRKGLKAGLNGNNVKLNSHAQDDRISLRFKFRFLYVKFQPMRLEFGLYVGCN